MFLIGREALAFKFLDRGFPAADFFRGGWQHGAQFADVSLPGGQGFDQGLALFARCGDGAARGPAEHLMIVVAQDRERFGKFRQPGLALLRRALLNRAARGLQLRQGFLVVDARVGMLLAGRVHADVEACAGINEFAECGGSGRVQQQILG